MELSRPLEQLLISCVKNLVIVEHHSTKSLSFNQSTPPNSALMAAPPSSIDFVHILPPPSITPPSLRPSSSPSNRLLPFRPSRPLRQKRRPPRLQDSLLPLIHARQPVPEAAADAGEQRIRPQRLLVEERAHLDAELPEACCEAYISASVSTLAHSL